MDKNRISKQALRYRPKGRRNIGRPKKRWRKQLHFEDQGTGNTPNSSETWWWWWWWWYVSLKGLNKCTKVAFLSKIFYSSVEELKLCSKLFLRVLYMLFNFGFIPPKNNVDWRVSYRRMQRTQRRNSAAFSVLSILNFPSVSTPMYSLMQTSKKVYEAGNDTSQTSISFIHFFNLKTRGNSVHKQDVCCRCLRFYSKN